ncbi:MAG: carboxypeptidase M32 [Planctomycetota bacterium]
MPTTTTTTPSAALPEAYAALLAHGREAFLLSSTAALLSWDQETGMPRGGGALRSQQLALLAGLCHERATDPRIADWLAACEADPAVQQDPLAAANVRGMRRDHARATRLPAALVRALAELESTAQQEWAEARAASDFARFRPLLQRMLELQRQKADCLRRGEQPRWDALADLYEPGMNAADLRRLFQPLRERLVALRQQLDRGTRPDDSFARCEIRPQRQEAFVREVLAAMGFDFARGRLDRSAHPFCTGAFGDVRLTTRFHKDNLLDALGSTMHEGGHGLYEQGLDPAHAGSPLGEAVSLGIHESQSRMWENHVGRSRAFWQWAAPVLHRHVVADVEDVARHDAEALWRGANVVTPSLIRVEADEATYDLHVMVRFELETALLSGDLEVADLPAAWNARYADYLGVAVPDDRRGCLQVVHWSCGLFGYFPTYTLGNLYAAQFAAAARRALPDLDAQMARGEFQPLREWLRANVHCHGRRYEPAALCERATGAPLSSAPFLAYLEDKLRAAYGL